MSASPSTHHTFGSPQIVSPPSPVDRGAERSVRHARQIDPEHRVTNDEVHHGEAHDVHSAGVLSDVSERPASAVRLYTLGTFQLLLNLGHGRSHDLARARVWGHGRAQDLLLLLLLRRRPLRRQEAAASLWPEADPTRRARLLRNALWNLRSSLAQYATIKDEDMYGDDGASSMALTLRDTAFALSLDLVISSEPESEPEEASASSLLQKESSGQYWCDLHAFETAASRVREGYSAVERIALGQAALRLYGGPFLPHRQGNPGAATEPSWILDQRTRAQAQWIRLSLDLATDLRHVGEREQALDLIMQTLEQDPLQLEAARRAMLLLSDLNRVDEALVVYERCRRCHRDAFHREPRDLKRIATQLRSGHVRGRTPSQASPHASDVYPFPVRASGVSKSDSPQRLSTPGNSTDTADRRLYR